MCFCVLLYFTACMLYYCNTVGWAWWDWGLIWWMTILLQCFDTVGWVTWPVKISSPHDLYCVEWDVKPYSTTTTTSINVDCTRRTAQPLHYQHNCVLCMHCCNVFLLCVTWLFIVVVNFVVSACVLNVDFSSCRLRYELSLCFKAYFWCCWCQFILIISKWLWYL